MPGALFRRIRLVSPSGCPFCDEGSAWPGDAWNRWLDGEFIRLPLLRGSPRLPYDASHDPHYLIQRRSDAIALARVICIMGVVYVHAWTGLSGDALQHARGSAQEDLRWVLMEVFGHSSVPLLGLISGWLVSGSARTRDWREHIRRKARTILLPMVAWNALAILFVSGSAFLFGLAAPQPSSVGWVLQELLIVSRNPDINVQMPFLRDLFVCMLLAPVLVRLPVKALVGVILLAGAFHIAGVGQPVMMRVAILFFFTLGMLVRRLDWADRVARMGWLVVALPFVIMIAASLYVTLLPDDAVPQPVDMAIDLATRIVAAAFYWRLTWALAGQSIRSSVLKIEPYAFFYFCAHLIVIWLGGPLVGKLTGKLGAPLYPLFLLAQPVLVLAVVIPLANVLMHYTPSLARMLSGGRLSKPRPQNALAA